MNPLTEVLPAKARKVLYALLFVASHGYAAWQGSEGDWTTFTGAIITSLFSATAASNTAVEG